MPTYAVGLNPATGEMVAKENPKDNKSTHTFLFVFGAYPCHTEEEALAKWTEHVAQKTGGSKTPEEYALETWQKCQVLDQKINALLGRIIE